MSGGSGTGGQTNPVVADVPVEPQRPDAFQRPVRANLVLVTAVLILLLLPFRPHSEPPPLAE